MIQCIDGMVMIKGSSHELMAELTAIAFSLTKKDFTDDEIASAIALGVAAAKEKDSDKFVKVILDKDTSKKTDSEMDEQIKKMFGDLFNK